MFKISYQEKEQEAVELVTLTDDELDVVTGGVANVQIFVFGGENVQNDQFGGGTINVTQ